MTLYNSVIESKEQKVYNSRWFQKKYINEYINDNTEEGVYLTRLLNFNNDILCINQNNYYNRIFTGFNISYEWIEDLINININPGKIILDSTYFIIDNIHTLKINPNNLNFFYKTKNQLLITVYYEFSDLIETFPIFRLYVYNLLSGNIYPNISNFNNNEIILDIFNINYKTKSLEMFYYDNIPECTTEEYDNGNNNNNGDGDGEEIVINYIHDHDFTHEHQYLHPHNHENILIESTNIGGSEIIIPEENNDENNNINEVILPLCSEFINYEDFPINTIIINNNIVNYNFTTIYYYYEYIYKLIMCWLTHILQMYARDVPIMNKIDFFRNNQIKYFGDSDYV